MTIASRPSAECCHVEISGWDTTNEFFVARAAIDWNDDETKRVSLRTAVREGTVVFLRVLQTFGHGTGLPVACRVVRTIERSGDGSAVVQLLPLHPHASAEGNAAAPPAASPIA